MITNFNIIKKVFSSQTFEDGDYRYDFISIEPEKYHVKFVVNCTLPKKGQSYISAKINDDIESILREYSKYIGQDFSYSFNFLVDNNQPSNAYISPKKYSEAISNLNKEYGRLSFMDGKLELNCSYRFPQNYIWGQTDLDIIDVDIICDVDEVFFEGKKVHVKEDKKNDFGAILVYLFYDEIDLPNKLANEVYSSWENEVQIDNTDLYYNVSLLVSKIERTETKQGVSPEDLYLPDFFTEIS